MAFLLLLAVSAAGCGRMQGAAPTSNDGYVVTMRSEPASPAVGVGALNITLRDPDGVPVEGATLAVIGNMTHAGMTPVEGAVQSAADGVYRVLMDWTMSGDWFIDITFTVRDGTVVSRHLPITVR